MTKTELADLHVEIFGLPTLPGVDGREGLAAVTSSHDNRGNGSRCWDVWETVPHAKPIGVSNWVDTWRVAIELDKALPGLGKPTPGADPDGFTWLTWRTQSGVEFALELHFDLLGARYRWTQTRDGFKRRFEVGSDRDRDLRPVLEALRATLGDTQAKRACATLVETHYSDG